MAGLRKLRGKYYARVSIPRPGQRPLEKLIGLNTSIQHEASIRRLEVEKHEGEMKDGIDFTFPWQNGHGFTEVIRLTLTEAVDRYMKTRKSDGLRQSTLNRYRVSLNHFINVVGKNMPVERLNNRHIDSFKSAFMGKHNAVGININLRGIKTFLIWLKEEGLIKQAPRVRLLNTGKPMPKYLTDAEFADMMKLDWLDNHFKRAFYFYRETGCRLSEPFYGIISGNWLTIESDNAKTHQTRDVYLTDELKQIAYELQDGLQRFKDRGFKTEQYFIWRYSMTFTKACEKCGIEGKTLHSLRHTFAVRRYLETRDIYNVAKELGHSSVTTTEIYARFDIRRLEQDFPDLMRQYKPIENNRKVMATDTESTVQNRKPFLFLDDKY